MQVPLSADPCVSPLPAHQVGLGSQLSSLSRASTPIGHGISLIAACEDAVTACPTLHAAEASSDLAVSGSADCSSIGSLLRLHRLLFAAEKSGWDCMQQPATLTTHPRSQYLFEMHGRCIQKPVHSFSQDTGNKLGCPPHPSEFADEILDLTVVWSRSSESEFLYLREEDTSNYAVCKEAWAIAEASPVHALTLASAVGAVISQLTPDHSLLASAVITQPLAYSLASICDCMW